MLAERSLLVRDRYMAGVLYIVATPLGNLEDITLRALRVLKEVDLIAAEDTTHSRKLLEHFKIRRPRISYYDRVEQQKAPLLVERLRRGESIALISDAGMPGIADPGYRLVRAAIEASIPVVPIPGPSAVIAALAAAGLPMNRFAFDGFVPARSSARREFYRRLAHEPRTVVCFETARRLRDSLADLFAILGDREIVVARELTKVHESFVRGTVRAVLEKIRDEELRGEVTLLVAPAARAAPIFEDELREQVRALRASGFSVKEITRRLAATSGRSRNEIYKVALAEEKRRE